MTLLRRRRGTHTDAWSRGADTPNGGSTYGTLDTYFNKINELDSRNFEAFFVTAKALGHDHLIQMSFGTGDGGKAVYEFDLPLTGWSRKYAAPVESEAKSLDLRPVRSDGPPMSFLDVSFPDAKAHEKFARWVVSDVFELSDNTQYEITWG